jgi:uncharacterized membrane protein
MGLKVLGIALVVVAILAAVIPVFNNCTAEGLFITTKDGREIDMKCLWTSRASIAVAIPLAGVGLMLTLSRRKETRRALGVTGVLLSAGLVALPTVLIGVCKMDKSCLNVMKPSLIILGVAGMVLSGAATALAGSGAANGEGDTGPSV